MLIFCKEYLLFMALKIRCTHKIKFVVVHESFEKHVIEVKTHSSSHVTLLICHMLCINDIVSSSKPQLC